MSVPSEGTDLVNTDRLWKIQTRKIPVVIQDGENSLSYWLQKNPV